MYNKYEVFKQHVIKDTSDGVNLLINSLPSLHTLILYFAPEDLKIYRSVYKNKGLNVISGDKLIGRDITHYLYF